VLDARAQALRQTLRSLSPRAAQALQYFAVEGRPLRDCAELFGISEPAFELMLLRASEELAAALSRSDEGAPRRPRKGPRWRFPEEAARAGRLREALEGRAVPAEPTLLSLRDAVRELMERAPRMRELDAEATSKAQAESGRGRQELWLRRLVIAAVLALTALLYAREELGKKPVRIEARPPQEPAKTGR
jgi:hypothetical protein